MKATSTMPVERNITITMTETEAKQIRDIHGKLSYSVIRDLLSADDYDAGRTSEQLYNALGEVL